jgi:hypothetical protein
MLTTEEKTQLGRYREAVLIQLTLQCDRATAKRLAFMRWRWAQEALTRQHNRRYWEPEAQG